MILQSPAKPDASENVGSQAADCPQTEARWSYCVPPHTIVNHFTSPEILVNKDTIRGTTILEITANAICNRHNLFSLKGVTWTFCFLLFLELICAAQNSLPN